MSKIAGTGKALSQIYGGMYTPSEIDKFFGGEISSACATNATAPVHSDPLKGVDALVALCAQQAKMITDLLARVAANDSAKTGFPDLGVDMGAWSSYINSGS